MQEDSHFLTLCRYVEANARLAKLVSQAQQWPWGSLWRRLQRKTDLPLADWPEDRPRNWLGLVNEAMEKEALKAVRVCVNRGRPYGAMEWAASTAVRLGLEFTLRTTPAGPAKRANGLEISDVPEPRTLSPNPRHNGTSGR